MIDHQAAVLHDFNTGAGELFGDGVVTNAKLHPYRLRFLSQQIVEVRGNVLRAAKNVDHIDCVRNLLQLTMDLFTENLGDVGIVNRDRNDPEAGILHVLGNVEGGLIGMCFGLDPEHSDALGFQEQFAHSV